MKTVVAIIKHHKLDEVCQKLSMIDGNGMTIMEVKGYGRQRGRFENDRDSSLGVTFLPKVRIEVAVTDEEVEKTIDAIATAARTGQIGDGKIFVYELDRAVRIRTGETDSQAI